MDAAAILRNGALGAAGGLAASLVMDGFQAGWSAVQTRLQPQANNDDGSSESSTEKAADAVTTAATGKPVPDEERKLAGQAVHYGFGALLGALYGAASTAFPATRTGFGLPFGAAVWAVADELLVPAAGLSEPPTEVPASEQAYALASHLVFGAVLHGSLKLFRAGAARLEETSERNR